MTLLSRYLCHGQVHFSEYLCNVTLAIGTIAPRRMFLVLKEVIFRRVFLVSWIAFRGEQQSVLNLYFSKLKNTVSLRCSSRQTMKTQLMILSWLHFFLNGGDVLWVQGRLKLGFRSPACSHDAVSMQQYRASLENSENCKL